MKHQHNDLIRHIVNEVLLSSRPTIFISGDRILIKDLDKQDVIKAAKLAGLNDLFIDYVMEDNATDSERAYDQEDRHL